MPEDTTKATASQTAAGAGNQVTEEGKAAGKDTQSPKSEAAQITTTKEFQEAVQSEVTRVIAKARKDEREKAEKEAQERADEEQKKFEKLANDRKAKIDELEPQVATLTTEVETYRSAIAEIAVSELKALPEEVRDASPARYEDKALVNPLEVLAWLPKGKKLAEGLGGTRARPGNTGDPRPKGSPGVTVEDIKQRKRASGQYAF